jgi:MYXO-CTERM domain-containing protein
VSATILRNGVGVDVLGTARLRNALVTRNRVGVAAAEAGRLATAFSDVFANGEAERRLVEGGVGDFTALVTFLDEESSDLRLPPAQATTDRGDPGDPFDAEPAPNGGRINLGAFGNTPYAELTGLVGEGLGATRQPGAPVAESPAHPDAPPLASDGGGCGCDLGAGAGSPAGALLAVGAAAFVTRRRRGR